MIALHLWLKLANVKRQIGGLRELNRLVAHVSEDARTRHVFGVKVPTNGTKNLFVNVRLKLL